jgi:hypothetical protein
MLLQWWNRKTPRRIRQKFIEAGKIRRERVLEEERRATQVEPETHSARSKTPPKGFKSQEKGLRSTRDRG